MRNPERITELLELLNRLWLRDSDLRFNQLIYILQSEYSSSNNGEGRVISKTEDGFTQTSFDMFNTEDDKFIEFLKNKLSN